MNERFKQKFIEFPEEDKKKLPVSYNYIYVFDKRGVIPKKGKAYYGVPVTVLHTPQFYCWGHNKLISKIINLEKISKANDKSNNEG